MINRSTIVFVGQFNPSIFHPTWFEKHKILPIQDTQWALGENAQKKEIQAEEGKIVITDRPPLLVQHDVARVDFKSLQLFAQQNRVDFVATDKAKFSMLREVVTKTFTLLNHTPIKAVGINFMGDIQFQVQAENILKGIFGGKQDFFEENFGENYQLGGTIVSSEENVRFSLKLARSEESEEAIHFDANFHRTITSEQAQEAIDIINENHADDQKRLENILKEMFKGVK